MISKKKFNIFDTFFSTEKELDHVDHGFKTKLILKLDYFFKHFQSSWIASDKLLSVAIQSQISMSIILYI